MHVRFHPQRIKYGVGGWRGDIFRFCILSSDSLQNNVTSIGGSEKFWTILRGGGRFLPIMTFFSHFSSTRGQPTHAPLLLRLAVKFSRQNGQLTVRQLLIFRVFCFLKFLSQHLSGFHHPTFIFLFFQTLSGEFKSEFLSRITSQIKWAPKTGLLEGSL